MNGIDSATIEKNIEKEKDAEEEPSTALIRETTKEDTSAAPSASKWNEVADASETQRLESSRAPASSEDEEFLETNHAYIYNKEELNVHLQ